MPCQFEIKENLDFLNDNCHHVWNSHWSTDAQVRVPCSWSHDDEWHLNKPWVFLYILVMHNPCCGIVPFDCFRGGVPNPAPEGSKITDKWQRSRPRICRYTVTTLLFTLLLFNYKIMDINIKFVLPLLPQQLPTLSWEDFPLQSLVEHGCRDLIPFRHKRISEVMQ